MMPRVTVRRKPNGPFLPGANSRANTPTTQPIIMVQSVITGAASCLDEVRTPKQPIRSVEERRVKGAGSRTADLVRNSQPSRPITGTPADEGEQRVRSLRRRAWLRDPTPPPMIGIGAVTIGVAALFGDAI